MKVYSNSKEFWRRGDRGRNVLCNSIVKSLPFFYFDLVTPYINTKFLNVTTLTKPMNLTFKYNEKLKISKTIITYDRSN